MIAFEPDTIIAIGGGSAMDAAKIMWVMYEHPEADFMDMAIRFAEMFIRDRPYLPRYRMSQMWRTSSKRNGYHGYVRLFKLVLYALLRRPQ